MRLSLVFAHVYHFQHASFFCVCTEGQGTEALVAAPSLELHGHGHGHAATSAGSWLLRRTKGTVGIQSKAQIQRPFF